MGKDDMCLGCWQFKNATCLGYALDVCLEESYDHITMYDTLEKRGEAKV